MNTYTYDQRDNLTAVGVGFAIGTGGIGGFLVGGAMTLFGAADLTEGGQDVYYGAKGSDKKSTNLIKDKVSRGSEEAYYAVEGALNLGLLGYGVLGNLNNPNAIKFKTNLTDRAKGVQNSSTADDIFSFDRYKETLVKGDVLENSKSIIEGEKLGDKKLIKELTADGSKISDWAKMESAYSYTNEWGTGKIHYYKNIKTGEINYYDAKMKIQAPKDLKSNLINTAVDKDGYWIVELDENLIPIGVRK